MIKTQRKCLSLIYTHILHEVLPNYTSGDCKRVSRIPKLLPKGFYAFHLVKRHQRWRKWVNFKRPENRLRVIYKAFHQPLKTDRKTEALAHISGIGYRAVIFLDVRNICWSREFLANDNTAPIDEGLPNSHNSSSCVVKRQGNIETITGAEPNNPGHCCCHIYKTATGIGKLRNSSF